MKSHYMALGNDGHLHEYPDQMAAEKIFRKQLMRMAGRSKLPEECDHAHESFNGYIWRCKDCGKRFR